MWLRSPTRGSLLHDRQGPRRSSGTDTAVLWRPEMLTWQHARMRLQVAKAHHHVSRGKAAARIWQAFREAPVRMENSTNRVRRMRQIRWSAHDAAGHGD